MANYTKTTWVEGGAPGINASQLNRIETGICESRWYKETTNNGNAYSVVLDPVPSAYYEGMTLRTKINAQNTTGPVTLNCNSLGAKGCKMLNGNDIPSGKLKANSIVTWVYNGTYFFLQGSDSAGTATAADVPTGKTFSNDTGTDIPGEMPVNESPATILNITGADTPYTDVPDGHNPGGRIIAQVDPSLADEIILGNNIGGVDGIGTAPVPTAGNQIVAQDPNIYTVLSDGGQDASKEFTIVVAGTYRVHVLIETTALANFYVANSNTYAQIGAYHHSLAGGEHSFDYTFNAGDKIILLMSSSSGATAYFKQISLRCAAGAVAHV